MPGLLTTAQLIEMVRQEAQLFDKSQVFDGYASEVELFPKGNHILPLLNRGLEKYVATGFNKCYFRLSVVSGTREYLLHRGAGRFTSCYLEDASGKQFFIEKTTITDLDKLYYQTWRNRQSPRPLGYYLVGTRGIGFDVTPTQAWTLVYLADSQVSNLVNPTDIPGRILDDDGHEVMAFDGSPESSLPETTHPGLAYYAASVLRHRMGDHAEGARLDGEYKEKLEELKALISSRNAAGPTRLTVRRQTTNYYGGM